MPDESPSAPQIRTACVPAIFPAVPARKARLSLDSAGGHFYINIVERTVNLVDENVGKKHYDENGAGGSG